MKKIIFSIIVVTFATVNTVYLTNNNKYLLSMDLKSTISDAQAESTESGPDDPCYAPSGSCSGWDTWAHN